MAPGVRYFSTFIVACGGHSIHPLTIAWLSNNGTSSFPLVTSMIYCSIDQRSPTVAGHYKCAAALAFQYGFGNIGGLIAPNIYLSSQAPGYPQGFGVSLALLLLGGFMCCVFFVGIKMENRKRDWGVCEIGGSICWLGERRIWGVIIRGLGLLLEMDVRGA